MAVRTLESPDDINYYTLPHLPPERPTHLRIHPLMQFLKNARDNLVSSRDQKYNAKKIKIEPITVAKSQKQRLERFRIRKTEFKRVVLSLLNAYGLPHVNYLGNKVINMSIVRQ